MALEFTLKGRCAHRKVVVFGVLLLLMAVKLLMGLSKERMIADRPWEEIKMSYDLSNNRPSPSTDILRDSNASSVYNRPSQSSNLPLIYFVTPTGVRTEQKADLTRLSHTLRLVPRLHWIVIEDRLNKSKLVGNLLANCKVPYTYLAVQTNQTFLEIGKNNPFLPRGVDQRNAGLDWIAQHGEYPSVFYPGDDDNAYDLQLFEQMRYTKKVSVWPVGLIGRAKFQTPVVRNGKVIDWATGWGKSRKFAIDMAGFAVNTELLKGPNPPRFSNAKSAHVETNFLEHLNIPLGELEPKADNCTKVLVWHTKTASSHLDRNIKLKLLLDKYNLPSLEV